MPVEVIAADASLRDVVRNLMTLYLYDFSEFDGADVDEHGTLTYEYFDQYWTDADRYPFLFRLDGQWIGFALVHAGDPHDMAEYFVMRKYRRRGVGVDAARAVFAQFPGAWTTRQQASNPGSTPFWRRAIPVEFTETVADHGPVQRFTIL